MPLSTSEEIVYAVVHDSLKSSVHKVHEDVLQKGDDWHPQKGRGGQACMKRRKKENNLRLRIYCRLFHIHCPRVRSRRREIIPLARSANSSREAGGRRALRNELGSTTVGAGRVGL